MDHPAHCPSGHPLGPGRYTLSFTLCDTCDVPGRGHQRLHCRTCDTRLLLEHPGAVWERWTGTAWVPA